MNRGRPKGTVTKTDLILANAWATIERKRAKRPELSVNAICKQLAFKAAQEGRPPFWLRKCVVNADGQRALKEHAWNCEPETIRQLYKDAQKRMRVDAAFREKAEFFRDLYIDADRDGTDLMTAFNKAFDGADE